MKLLAAFVAIIVGLLVLGHFLSGPSPVQVPKTQTTVDTAKDHAAELVKLIDAGLRSGDWTGFDKACDLDAFARRVIGSAEFSGPMRDCISQIVKGDELLGPRNALRDLFQGSTEWKLLYLRSRPEGQRVAFRIFGPAGFLGYAEFHLAAGPTEGPRIADVYIPLFGALASDYLRRMHVPPPAVLEVLNSLRAPTPLHLFRGREELFRLMELGREGKWTEAEEFFDQHRKALLGDKLAHLFRLRNAGAAGPKSYVKAFEEFEKHCPDDPSLRFLRISYLRFQGKCDEALDAINVIDREIGGDPYLDSLRAMVCLDAGQIPQAEVFSMKCTDADPQLAEGWYVRILVSLHKKDAGGAARHLAAADKASKIDMRRIEALPGFEEFAKTEEYRAWKDSRPSE